MKVLIIKTGNCETFQRCLPSKEISYGDVLRVTPLLHLFDKNDRVSWVTDPSVFPLLWGLPVSLEYADFLGFIGIKRQRWDLAINLEWSYNTCWLMEELYSRSKIGYLLKKREIVFSHPSEHEGWSERLFALMGEKWEGQGYSVAHNEIRPESDLVYLNTRVGNKIPEKKWSQWEELKHLIEETGLRTTQQQSTRLREYVEEIQRASFVISTDSLGLYIALALNRPVLGLFGPTNAREVSGLEYYIQKSSMDEIKPEDVYQELNKLCRKSL